MVRGNLMTLSIGCQIDMWFLDLDRRGIFAHIHCKYYGQSLCRIESFHILGRFWSNEIHWECPRIVHA